MKTPKAVMMSINPEWCDLIVQGKKTVELRKSMPCSRVHVKLMPDITVYIYCTKGVKAFPVGQKVIGQFTCRWFDHIFPEGFLVDDKFLCSNPA